MDIWNLLCRESVVWDIVWNLFHGMYYGILFMESVFIENMFVVGLFGSGKFQQESGCIWFSTKTQNRLIL